MLTSEVVRPEQLTGLLRSDQKTFVSWVIYEKPKDFPEHFVLRRWFWTEPDRCCQLFDTLDDARRHVPSGHYRMPPEPNDERTIREVWV